MDRGDRLEEGARLLDGHVEHLGDRLTLVVDLQGLAVVPGPVADLTRHVDVRKEVHLDLDGAFTLAVLTASPLDVEGEPALLVAAHLGLGGLGEEGTNLVEDPGVRCRVRPRRPPNRGLVDMNDLVDLLDAGHRLVLARDRPSSVNPVCQRGVENLVDQRRLARTTHSRDNDELAQREGDIHVLQIVLTSALDDQLPSGSGTSARRQRDGPLARQVGTRQRPLAVQQIVDGSRDDDLSAVLAGSRADIDNPVGDANGVLVMLDDDERVPEIPQPDKGVDETAVVALVQADGGLVEDVEHTDQSRTNLSGQSDALSLTARQRSG